jgi:4,5-dihydroxyphthalate decarboxylase
MVLSITYAGGQYDRTRGLWTGSIVPEGVAVRYEALPVEEIFLRMLTSMEFDAAEMSLASYAIARDQGTHDLVAIPVFPSRSFRLSCIYVREDSPLERLADLRGRRVAMPEYQMTAAVWQRGILQEQYGVPADSVHWVTGRPEKLPIHPPVRLEQYTGPGGLPGALADGKVDALMAARMPGPFARKAGLRRLLRESRAEEEAYFRRTGHFPIMHTVVLRGELYRANPWIGRALYDAFVRAKVDALQALYDTTSLHATLPWLVEELEAVRDLMGDDYWPYGFQACRGTVDTLLRYLFEQGLTDRRLRPEELFVPDLLT